MDGISGSGCAERPAKSRVCGTMVPHHTTYLYTFKKFAFYIEKGLLTNDRKPTPLLNRPLRLG
jgi:hypothetical protein